MLQQELSGADYSKTAHRQRLAPQLQGRSDGSIEFKHANISAVLVGFGLPYIDGYKPRGNYQRLLEQAVLEYLTANDDLLPGLADSPVVDPVSPIAVPVEFAAVLEEPPDRAELTPIAWSPDRPLVRVDFVRRDAENRRLGRLGEESCSRSSGGGRMTTRSGRTCRGWSSGRRTSEATAPAMTSRRSTRMDHDGLSK